MRVYAIALLLCAATCLHGTVAAALRETDPDYSSSDSDAHILSLVKHVKIGDVIFAKPSDIDQLSKFVAEKSSQDDGTACFASEPTMEAEDGPVLELTRDHSSRESSPQEENKCTKEVNSVFYYPEYAVGLLDNGCTAFLIGPYHAMTLAKCVYNHHERLWDKNLDFWRGRNDSLYLQRMEWEEVYIPRLFFEEGRERHDWALIFFDKSQSSPVWHAIEYCPDKCPGPYVTSYGYLNNNLNMFQKDCEIESDCHKHLTMHCCLSQTVYRGGPVVNGYRIESYKVPPVVGITSALKHKHNEEDDADVLVETAVTFNSDMFWSTCFLLSKTGYEPDCKKV